MWFWMKESINFSQVPSSGKAVFLWPQTDAMLKTGNLIAYPFQFNKKEKDYWSGNQFKGVTVGKVWKINF